eukprot:7807299-Pyramimonas_sp.AAC.1
MTRCRRCERNGPINAHRLGMSMRPPETIRLRISREGDGLNEGGGERGRGITKEKVRGGER